MRKASWFNVGSLALGLAFLYLYSLAIHRA